MITLRRDRRQIALFRIKYASRSQEPNKRVRNISDFDPEDVVNALFASLGTQAATTCYTVDGDYFLGPPQPSHIQVTLEDVVENFDAAGKLHSHAFRFSYSNPRAADPGKKHLVTGQSEVLHIKADEAVNVGAHLVIGQVENAGKFAGFAKCALEQVPGLARGKVITNLNEVAERHLGAAERPDYSFEEKIGKKSRTVNGKSKLYIKVDLEKSESLENDANQKILDQIIFVGDVNSTDNLDDVAFEKIEQRIVAKVEDRHSRGEAAKDVLRRAIAKARGQGLTAKAEFSFKDHGDTRRQIRELDLDKSSLADQLFAKLIVVESSAPLPSMYTKTSTDMVAKLQSLLDDSTNWL